MDLSRIPLWWIPTTEPVAVDICIRFSWIFVHPDYNRLGAIVRWTAGRVYCYVIHNNSPSTRVFTCIVQREMIQYTWKRAWIVNCYIIQNINCYVIQCSVNRELLCNSAWTDQSMKKSRCYSDRKNNCLVLISYKFAHQLCESIVVQARCFTFKTFFRITRKLAFGRRGPVCESEKKKKPQAAQALC